MTSAAPDFASSIQAPTTIQVALVKTKCHDHAITVHISFTAQVATHKCAEIILTRKPHRWKRRCVHIKSTEIYGEELPLDVVLCTLDDSGSVVRQRLCRVVPVITLLLAVTSLTSRTSDRTSNRKHFRA